MGRSSTPTANICSADHQETLERLADRVVELTRAISLRRAAQLERSEDCDAFSGDEARLDCDGDGDGSDDDVGAKDNAVHLSLSGLWAAFSGIAAHLEFHGPRVSSMAPTFRQDKGADSLTHVT